MFQILPTYFSMIVPTHVAQYRSIYVRVLNEHAIFDAMREFAWRERAGKREEDHGSGGLQYSVTTRDLTAASLREEYISLKLHMLRITVWDMDGIRSFPPTF
jgi:hypothetical protein